MHFRTAAADRCEVEVAPVDVRLVALLAEHALRAGTHPRTVHSRPRIETGPLHRLGDLVDDVLRGKVQVGSDTPAFELFQRQQIQHYTIDWAGEALIVLRQHRAVRKRRSFLNFSYVCPKPVLVNGSFLALNGAKRGVFLPDEAQRELKARGRVAQLEDSLRRAHDHRELLQRLRRAERRRRRCWRPCPGEDTEGGPRVFHHRRRARLEVAGAGRIEHVRGAPGGAVAGLVAVVRGLRGKIGDVAAARADVVAGLHGGGTGLRRHRQRRHAARAEVAVGLTADVQHAHHLLGGLVPVPHDVRGRVVGHEPGLHVRVGGQQRDGGRAEAGHELRRGARGRCCEQRRLEEEHQRWPPSEHGRTLQRHLRTCAIVRTGWRPSNAESEARAFSSGFILPLAGRSSLLLRALPK
jgi:hypothetical protein